MNFQSIQRLIDFIINMTTERANAEREKMRRGEKKKRERARERREKKKSNEGSKRRRRRTSRKNEDGRRKAPRLEKLARGRPLPRAGLARSPPWKASEGAIRYRVSRSACSCVNAETT